MLPVIVLIELTVTVCWTLVPLAVGDATAEDVAEVLEKLWGGPETLIVISSDLSHYHDYRTAGKMDRATSQAIEALKPDILIKGADWRGKKVAGADAVKAIGGRVEFIKYIQGLSTTNIIEKISRSCAAK